jgi:hypothetical protein
MLNYLAGTVKSALADPLADYKVNEASAVMAGHKQLLRVMEATERATSNSVSVFSCSIQALESRCGSPAESQLTLKKLRDGVALLTRMKHPSLLRVVMPLVEDKGRKRLVFVTERVECVVATQLNDGTVSRQEVLLGLYRCGEALEFLHTKAGVLLANFAPSSLFITPGGNWKIGDLMHAVMWQQPQSASRDDSNNPHTLLTESIVRFTFHSPSSPELDYYAPEMLEFATKNAGSGIAVDLFDTMHGPSTPLFPDSDTFSFVATCAFLLEKKKLFTSGDEPSVYRRQRSDADEFARRMYPSWMPNGVSAAPRIALLSLIESDSFASLDIRLLVELTGYVSLEPRRKLQVLKGLHDELARNSFAEKMIVLKIVPLLLSECREDRMYRFILPIALEAANGLSSAAFESSQLRCYVLSVIQSCIQTPVTTEGSPFEILLQQLLEKFERYCAHFSSAKDLNTLVLGMLVRSVQCSTASSAQQMSLATVGLQTLKFVLQQFERPFATGDVLVGALLHLLMVLPTQSTAVVDCVVKLLPWTTRDVREAELEPKLIAGMRELSNKQSSTNDTEKIMKLLVSIVSESSIEHVATVTLPLLCPLLVLGNHTVRCTVSQYVARLLTMVTEKKAEQEQQEAARDHQARLALTSQHQQLPSLGPSIAKNAQPLCARHTDAATSSNLTFFSSAATPSVASHPASLKNKAATDDDIRAAFGF